MELDGKIAIVTGAARGIGCAIAQRFCTAGAIVVALDVAPTESSARSIADRGGRVITHALDITDHERVTQMVDEIARTHGGIDILVNNAGIIARGTIETLNHETWKRVIDVNLHGTFNMCKAVSRHMIKRMSGRVLSITSIAGKMGDITAAPAYGTSKGALNTFTRSLARQLAQHGITVNAIAPHAVETDMSAEWTEEKRRAVIESIPLRRLARPEEVAEAALFLVSDGAAFITGETLNINGGALMD